MPSRLRKVPIVFQTSLTANHRRIMSILNDLNYTPDPEYLFPPYVVDIYIREFHLAIEYDGPGHNKKKDSERDSLLLIRYNLPIIRYDRVPKSEEIIDDIDEALVLYGNPKDRIRKAGL